MNKVVVTARRNILFQRCSLWGLNTEETSTPCPGREGQPVLWVKKNRIIEGETVGGDVMAGKELKPPRFPLAITGHVNRSRFCSMPGCLPKTTTGSGIRRHAVHFPIGARRRFRLECHAAMRPALFHRAPFQVNPHEMEQRSMRRYTSPAYTEASSAFARAAKLYVRNS